MKKDNDNEIKISLNLGKKTKDPNFDKSNLFDEEYLYEINNTNFLLKKNK